MDVPRTDREADGSATDCFGAREAAWWVFPDAVETAEQPKDATQHPAIGVVTDADSART